MALVSAVHSLIGEAPDSTVVSARFLVYKLSVVLVIEISTSYTPFSGGLLNPCQTSHFLLTVPNVGFHAFHVLTNRIRRF